MASENVSGDVAALAPVEAPGMLDSITGAIQAGGPVVGILMTCSLVASIIVIVKLVQFRKAGLWRRSDVGSALGAWRTGQTYAAVRSLAERNDPVTVIVRDCMMTRLAGVADDRIHEEGLRRSASLLASLREWLRPLELIASLAPLLGLFGTVLGMIEAFQQMEQAGSQVNPAVLSGGIWEALLTTAVGLAVAMPVLTVLTWFERRIERVAQELEDALQQIFFTELTHLIAESVKHDAAIPEPAASPAG